MHLYNLFLYLLNNKKMFKESCDNIDFLEKQIKELLEGSTKAGTMNLDDSDHIARQTGGNLDT